MARIYKRKGTEELVSEESKRIYRRRPKPFIVKLISAGYDDIEIKEILKDEYGYAPDTINDLMRLARKQIDKQIEKYADIAAERNYLRLEAMVQEALESGNDKTVLAAIDLENKLLGCYNQKITLASDKDEPFVIKYE